MRIDYLFRHSHYLPTLAEWMYREWFHPVGLTREQAANQLHQRLQADALPLALVAFADEPLGMVCLLADVPPDGHEPIACLAGLYVAPAQRRQGVGGRLCQRALVEARRLGHSKLYLYTPNRAAFYAHLGWVKIVETLVEAGDFHEISTFMEYVVAPGVASHDSLPESQLGSLAKLAETRPSR